MLSPDTFVINPRNRAFIAGQAPKPVGLARFPGCMLLFMLPFVLVGLFTVGLALNEWYEVVGYATARRTAEALVTDKGITSDEDGDSYYVVYSYSDRDGRRHSGRDNVSWDEYGQFEVEETFEVEYVAYDPGRSQIAGRGVGLGEAAFATFFTLFWNGITWFMTGLILMSVTRSRRLLRRGRLINGTLTRYSASLDEDNDLQVKIEYACHSPLGQLLKGHYQGFHNELKGKPEPAPGTALAVLYADEKTHTIL